MFLIHKEAKAPKYDHKAAQQVFGVDPERERLILVADPKASNPVDTRLRQIGMAMDNTVDLRDEFKEKWALVLGGDGVLHKGRIKDIYSDRSMRIKTRKDRDVIVPFENVRLISEREIA